jgi:hypothetical protein
LAFFFFYFLILGVQLVLPPSYDTGHNFGTFDPPLEAYIRESRLEEWKKDHEHLEHHREHNHEETPLRPIVDPGTVNHNFLAALEK